MEEDSYESSSFIEETGVNSGIGDDCDDIADFQHNLSIQDKVDDIAAKLKAGANDALKKMALEMEDLYLKSETFESKIEDFEFPGSNLLVLSVSTLFVLSTFFFLSYKMYNTLENWKYAFIFPTFSFVSLYLIHGSYPLAFCAALAFLTDDKISVPGDYNIRTTIVNGVSMLITGIIMYEPDIKYGKYTPLLVLVLPLLNFILSCIIEEEGSIYNETVIPYIIACIYLAKEFFNKTSYTLSYIREPVINEIFGKLRLPFFVAIAYIVAQFVGIVSFFSANSESEIGDMVVPITDFLQEIPSGNFGIIIGSCIALLIAGTDTGLLFFWMSLLFVSVLRSTLDSTSTFAYVDFLIAFVYGTSISISNCRSLYVRSIAEIVLVSFSLLRLNLLFSGDVLDDSY